MSMPTGQRVRGSIMICVWEEVRKSCHKWPFEKDLTLKFENFCSFGKQLYGDAPDSNGIFTNIY